MIFFQNYNHICTNFENVYDTKSCSMRNANHKFIEKIIVCWFSDAHGYISDILCSQMFLLVSEASGCSMVVRLAGEYVRPRTRIYTFIGVHPEGISEMEARV